MAGIGKESIWKELKGQVLLGSKEYIEKFIEFVKGKGENKRHSSKSALLN